jgi:hypothetical protein
VIGQVELFIIIVVILVFFRAEEYRGFLEQAKKARKVWTELKQDFMKSVVQPVKDSIKFDKPDQN